MPGGPPGPFFFFPFPFSFPFSFPLPSSPFPDSPFPSSAFASVSFPSVALPLGSSLGTSLKITNIRGEKIDEKIEKQTSRNQHR